MKSMTGYGRGAANTDTFSLSVEISSVNRKNLDMRINYPREYLALETLIRKKISAKLSRGTISGNIQISSTKGANSAKINQEALSSYFSELISFHDYAGLKIEPDTVRMLSLPGVLDESGKKYEEDEILHAAGKALDQALENMIENRSREGEAMRKDFEVRLELMQKFLTQIKVLAPQSLIDFREKLSQRLNDADINVEIDPDRLVQEVVIYADRCDITEEIVRLEAHLEQFAKLMTKTSPIGREMDFLMQEIGREVNTTGSKSSHSELSALIVQFKAELEKCREQMANVE